MYSYILRIAQVAAAKKSIGSKIHFNLDAESASTNKILLDFPFNKNLVFTTGSSACFPTLPSDNQRELDAINKVKGKIQRIIISCHDIKTNTSSGKNYFFKLSLGFFIIIWIAHRRIRTRIFPCSQRLFWSIYLILFFCQKRNPISKPLLRKKVWKYIDTVLLKKISQLTVNTGDFMFFTKTCYFFKLLTQETFKNVFHLKQKWDKNVIKSLGFTDSQVRHIELTLDKMCPCRL